ncbi:MAG: poly(R)-hydroxyalkanoic acid synthase subunit PhaE, partial [Deltaproteobacteria bacterium]
IRRKWTAAYEKLIREAFGIPETSCMEVFLEQARSLMNNLSKSLLGSPAYRMENLLNMGFSSGNRSLFDAVPGGTAWLSLWTDSYENIVGKFFRLPRFGLAREHEERVQKAMNAQLAFLKALYPLWELLLGTARSAVNRVMDNVKQLEVKQITPETGQLFYKIWLSNSEDAYIELFKSDLFCRTLGNTINSGLEAKKKMDKVMTYGLSFWNIPSQTDMNEVYEAIYSLRKQVRNLESELAEVRQAGKKRLRKEIIHENI